VTNDRRPTTNDQQLAASSQQPTANSPILLRVLLLLLVLLAFGRVVWALDMKNLWWDESLSLQRAESDWLPLLRGTLLITDGETAMATTDQHPFFFFVVLGVLLRLAGDSEFVLRFPSAMAATLLVPTVWTFARWLVRRTVLTASAPYWAALFAAISPFFLWYGQEARPYALWAWLALLSTYLLLRAAANTTEDGWSWSWGAGYGMVLVLFLTTHYYAVFLVPLHTLILYQWLAARNRRRALLLTAGVLIGGAVVGGVAARGLLQRGGMNFASAPLRIILPDLLNAFSLGLSVDAGQWLVRWLDWIYGAVALLGAAWALRSRRVALAGGWLLPAFILIPLGVLRVASLLHPAYMNARHMSLLGGGFALLLGSGVGVVWSRQRWAAGALALLLVAGAGYSSVNYFTAHDYAQKYDDYNALARHLERRILPGDLLLLNPAASWRIFQYYLPLDRIDASHSMDANGTSTENGPKHGVPAAEYAGVPRLGAPWAHTFDFLDEAKNHYRRIWLITSGTNPYLDLENRTEAWLADNLYLLQSKKFYSHSELRADLYVPEPPVYTAAETDIAAESQTPLDVVFGKQIRLVGYEIGKPITPESAIPVTLYWRTLRETDRRYKYILQWVEIQPNGGERVLATTEREPYEGAIPTIYWHPKQIIVEYSELPPMPERATAAGTPHLRVQVYAADTLEKLPITHATLDTAPGATVAEDGVTLVLPTVGQ